MHSWFWRFSTTVFGAFALLDSDLLSSDFLLWHSSAIVICRLASQKKSQFRTCTCAFSFLSLPLRPQRVMLKATVCCLDPKYEKMKSTIGWPVDVHGHVCSPWLSSYCAEFLLEEQRRECHCTHLHGFDLATTRAEEQNTRSMVPMVFPSRVYSVTDGNAWVGSHALLWLQTCWLDRPRR